ncbi:MAG: hypothetical protein VX310_03180 [Gemmatimonadota bacterium]|nr:hypothetical protein [Gemmatimonadota bacterium]
MPAPSMTSENIISSKYTPTAVIPLLAASMFVIPGCGEGEAPASGGSETAPPATVQSALPEVEIDLDEFVVLMDARLPTGPVSLRLANRGFEEHNLAFFVLESDSIVWETDGRLNPGERRSVTLDLAAGEYRAVCNFSDHEDRGMIVEFRAQENTPRGDGADG